MEQSKNDPRRPQRRLLLMEEGMYLLKREHISAARTKRHEKEEEGTAGVK